MFPNFTSLDDMVVRMLDFHVFLGQSFSLSTIPTCVGMICHGHTSSRARSALPSIANDCELQVSFRRRNHSDTCKYFSADHDVIFSYVCADDLLLGRLPMFGQPF